jgi:hypothetical protein
MLQVHKATNGQALSIRALRDERGDLARDIGDGINYHRSPTHGYAATREDAMAAFKKSWERQ